MRIDKSGYLRLNASIWNSKNALVLRLIENDIVSYLENIGDLECTAQARKLSVVSKENDARFSLEFKRANPDEAIPNSSRLFHKTVLDRAPDLARRVDSDLKLRSGILIDADGLVPTIAMEIAVHGPGFRIDTTMKGIILDLTGLGYDRAVMTSKFFGEHAFKLNFRNEKTGYRELVHLGSE